MEDIPGPRIRFAGLELEQLPDDQVRVHVNLERYGGTVITGTVDGQSSPAGILRSAALASLAALEQVMESRYVFELLGVKAVNAFDATVVVVALSAQQEASARRLVGSYLANEDPESGAAIAVLNATNRLLAQGPLSHP